MILESILSFVGGGLLRFATSVLEHKDKQKERDHEFRMFDLQIEADKSRSKLRIDEVRAVGDVQESLSEMDALVTASTAQAQRSGVKFIDAMNMSVRPVLTYWWCVVLYSVNKLILLYIALKSELALKEVAGVVFTEFDAAVVASMIGFWFVDRAIRKRASK